MKINNRLQCPCGFMKSDPFDEAFFRLASDVATTLQMENAMSGKSDPKVAKSALKSNKESDDLPFRVASAPPRDPVEILRTVLKNCKRKRKSMQSEELEIDDYRLSQLSRFTDKFNLTPYTRFLHYVPRLVNVVTLAEAIPVANTGVTLPLNLRHIAARCKNAYYAPKKFSAVQLAYSEPRCRVLVFRACQWPRTPPDYMCFLWWFLTHNPTSFAHRHRTARRHRNIGSDSSATCIATSTATVV